MFIQLHFFFKNMFEFKAGSLFDKKKLLRSE